MVGNTDETTVRKSLPLGLLLLSILLHCLNAESAVGQAGFREALEKMDKDQDGRLSKDEITPLARPYLERITRARRMSMNETNEISRLLEAGRIYHALKNGVSDEKVQPNPEAYINDFGPLKDEKLVPEFGLREMKYAYTQDDLDEADRTMRRCDRNRDGFINYDEAKNEHWTHRNPFDMDLNKDGKLDRMELAQRYARRRLLDDASDEIRRKDWRVGNGIEPSRRREKNEGRRENEWWKNPSDRNHLTHSVMRRFDANRNGRLEPSEAASLGISAGRLDANSNGEIDHEEIEAFLNQLQDASGENTEGLPAWFFERDVNQDAQVSMMEFSDNWTDTTFAEFAMYDANGDGLLTSTEASQSTAVLGGSFSNEVAQLIGPHKTIISEIEISDDFMVADINVELSITHSNCDQLDGFLTGPDGQKIELFTSVGGHDDHFEKTVFDDQSGYPIVKARPPFRGTFMPEGKMKRQPSLDHFNGKSIQGVWQLIIVGSRSDRFGMLNGWKMMVRPQQDVEGVSVKPQQDGPQRDRGSEDRRRREWEESRRREAEGKREEARKRMAMAKQGEAGGQARGKEGWGRNIDLSNLSDEDRKKLEEKKREWAEKYKRYMESRAKKMAQDQEKRDQKAKSKKK